MQTDEIPRRDWVAYLTAFSAIHQGWLVSLELLAPELGVQSEVLNAPLLGVSAELRDDGVVIVTVARSPREHITHFVPDVAHIWVERTEEGADAALCFQSVDGTKTILRFRAAVLPETVDGLARL